MPQEQTVYRWNNIISLLPATLAMSPQLELRPSIGVGGSRWLDGWMAGRLKDWKAGQPQICAQKLSNLKFNQ